MRNLLFLDMRPKILKEYSCKKCGKVNGTCRSDTYFMNCPEVLIVNLKRYRIDPKNPKEFIKSDSLIYNDPILDLNPFLLLEGNT